MKPEIQPSLTINVQELKKAALLYRAINNKLRQQLLKFIHGKGRAGVSEIRNGLKLEQLVVSLHLAILREAGLVSREAVGRQVFYTVNYVRLYQLHEMAANLLD